MRAIRAFLNRIGGLFNKERRERELAEEIESHLQLQIDDNLRGGMSPAEARRSAPLQFGAIESMREDYRERRGLAWLESLVRDLQYGARTLRRNPGFTAIAVLTLAIGIGGCAAMYAYIEQLVLLEYPYRDLDSLVVVQGVDLQTPGSGSGITEKAMSALRSDSRFFEDIGGFTTDGFVLTANEELQILEGALVTPNIFDVLGVKPLLGRTFHKDEVGPGKDNVVILGERAWRRFFGARNDIIGLAIELSRRTYTVVGVMPSGFWRERDVWKPLGVDPLEAGRMRTWARLKQPNSHTQAQAELDVLSDRIARDEPGTRSTWRLQLLNPFELTGSQLGTLGAFLIAPVALVFLIVCANVAHLQLGRDAQRTREMAVRLAIGASRTRLTRQLLIESLLLSLLGGGLGTAVALWGINAIGGYLPAGSIELIGRLQLDPDVLLFLALLSAVSSILFGLAPAVRVSGVNLTGSLKEGSGRYTSRRSSRNVLVISELALSMVLLVGTGLMAMLFQYVTRAGMGFDEKNLWTARLSLRGPAALNDASRRNWTAAMLQQVEGVSGVVSASVASELPLLGGEGRRFEPAGERFSGEMAAQAEYRAVSPGYFATMRVPILHGRPFDDGDREGGTPVAIINETMARQYFPKGALGRHVRFFREETAPGEADYALADVREIIGVAGDERQSPTDALPAQPIAYVPHSQNPIAPLSLVIRTQGSPNAVGLVVLDRIGVPSSEAILQSAFVFEEAIRDRIRARAFLPASMAVFAVLGLILTAVGLYGTTSRAVVQRTQEFGIRQALGARSADVLRLVLGQSALAGVIGLSAGVAGSFVAGRLFLGTMAPDERSAFGADLLGAWEILLVGGTAAAVLIAVVLLATYLPAHRATRVDPMRALRSE